MKAKKLLAAGTVCAIPGLGATVPAFAGSINTNTTVSCDGTTVKTLATRNTTGQGNMSVFVNSATQSSTTSFNAISQNGNAVGARSAAAGQTVAWSSVLTGTYTLTAVRVGAKNCNGIGLGHGNYTLNSTWTYVG